MVVKMDSFSFFMDYENIRGYADNLYTNDNEKCLEAIIRVKNSVIGSNKQKGSVIAQGIVPRLMRLLAGEPEISTAIRLEAAVTLGSLAHGSEFHVSALADAQLVPLLMSVIEESNENTEDKDHRALVAACLRCLRSLAQSGFYPRIDEPPRLLLNLAASEQPTGNRACVAAILAAACVETTEQDALCEANAGPILANLLVDAPESLLPPALECIAAFSKDHNQAAQSLVNVGCVELLANLVQRSKPPHIQLGAARCLAHLHRAGAIAANDPRIVYRALPCLARLCHREQPSEIRAEAADALAYLAEVDTDLQKTASISYHLISELKDLLSEAVIEGRQAAFKAFAALGANDEGIRKKIIETDNLMPRLVLNLGSHNESVRLAAVRCLHSLSRSVQQLRTTFNDFCVWQPLMALLTSSPPPCTELLTVASSTLCNLLLEFSPAKEPILELGAVKLLCELTESPEAALRLNGVWALMNMAFQAEQRVKSQILNAMGTDRIFRLLGDSDARVLMKTLGLLRNLLSTRSHIDAIMSVHALQVMQGIVLVLEGPHGPTVKEQALCVLGNIADGDRAKEHIMSNEDVLKKLIHYMMHSDSRLQAAAIFCIGNLARHEEAGAIERQQRLRAFGVLNRLQQLSNTQDMSLFVKVQAAIAEFKEP
ncbi:armadillo repeat-containing protein 8-like [Chrysoperla carnea]|uniref:armadillo repeat-containing protein 8-like n=1 Tax=Chrysoperla carnea TaxID=189513 RepID=UPI001D06577A|nr:armadillo repeat-containing protein 8-like [Chrysoperla carnea]